MKIGTINYVLVFNCFFLGFFKINTSFAQEFTWQGVAKVHVRDSSDNFISTSFPSNSGHKTVDPGTHLEISNLSLTGTIDWKDWKVLAKVDAIDLYEKNPTSSDYNVSVDQFILRYGTRLQPRALALTTSFYAQIGKFNKFEMQTDRHLESYGLASTAFNRFEDAGLEMGIDHKNGMYGKITYTSGNPVFFRDPLSLAGDNGVENPEYGPGFLVLYDAEVENDFDFGNTAELGLAVGFRWATSRGKSRYNLMAYHYKRDLAKSKELNGTFYGGDIDLFEFSELFFPGPVDPDNDLASIPLDSNSKKESGLTFWFYQQSSTLFAQYVQQDIGGLKRKGFEIEAGYAIQRGAHHWVKQWVPAIRYSHLRNSFDTMPLYPSPSIGWDWRKVDVGITAFLNKSLSIAIEYTFNEFETKGGDRTNNEALVTLRWRFD